MWGSNIKNKSENTILKIDKIGQMFVPGALDDTEKMRKAGADIFAKSGPENPNKSEKIKIFSGIFPVFPVEFAKNP